ncbi:MAG: hypothetical protein PHF84_08490, partial [bacterium]|nr:hypothetical protein [bacterium]
MKKSALLALILLIIFTQLCSAAHQATNIYSSLSPTNFIVGKNADIRYIFELSAETNAKADSFIISNAFFDYPINNVTSITVLDSISSNAQWLMHSTSRPSGDNQFTWNYNNGLLTLLTKISAVTTAQKVYIHFQQDLPTITGTNYIYNSLYSNSGTDDRILKACTNKALPWNLDLMPDALNKFELKGYPTICTAGRTWNNVTKVTVIAYDRFNNIKTDCTNNFYFATTSLFHYLKYSNNNTSCTLRLSDRGMKSFDGTDFEFDVAGNQYLIVTNTYSNKVRRSGVIQVTASTCNNFLSRISVQTAMVYTPFSIIITGVTDSYGNKINDIAVISVTNTGISNALNNIVVNNGIGSNSQIIKTAFTNNVIFKVRVGTISNYLSLSNVLP